MLFCFWWRGIVGQDIFDGGGWPERVAYPRPIFFLGPRD